VGNLNKLHRNCKTNPCTVNPPLTHEAQNENPLKKARQGSLKEGIKSSGTKKKNLNQENDRSYYPAV